MPINPRGRQGPPGMPKGGERWLLPPPVYAPGIDECSTSWFRQKMSSWHWHRQWLFIQQIKYRQKSFSYIYLRNREIENQVTIAGNHRLSLLVHHSSLHHHSLGSNPLEASFLLCRNHAPIPCESCWQPPLCPPTTVRWS